MLAMSDRNIDNFLPIFARTGANVAFLVPTPTGFEKSIMDCTAPVRELLKNSGIHNYETQLQGPDNKKIVKTYFVYDGKVVETKASLYRPITKKGDPRIWFYGLQKYCIPCNLLSLIIIDKCIYVINLSDSSICKSLLGGGFVYDILCQSVKKQRQVAEELLRKIIFIHKQGLIPAITKGDTAVGDTLENALNIPRNNNKTPDYKGIELKAHRITRNGKPRKPTRNTLFTKVPDLGLTYRDIVLTYGEIQTPRGKTDQTARLQLYETFRVSRANAYHLQLWVDYAKNELDIRYKQDRNETGNGKYVSSWFIDGLKQALLTKHKETFWVGAYSDTSTEGRELFRYDTIEHTKNPNSSLLVPLLEEDKITIDLAAHIDPITNKYRDHGVLFKMKPEDLPLLFSNPDYYDLRTMSKNGHPLDI